MTKKDLELFWLECAIDARPDVFTGAIQPGESPDFVLTVGTGRAGVEITRYATERVTGVAVPEQQDSLQVKSLQLARRIFESQCATPLRVQAVFVQGTFRTEAAVRLLADTIAGYLLPRIANAPAWSQIEWTSDDELELPAELGYLSARVMPAPQFADWLPANAGWVSNAGQGQLARIVAAKEPNIARYRQACEILILLIVFEGRPQPIGVVHAPTEPVEFTIPTGFDRVFCLDVRERRVVELPISRPAA